MIFHQRVATKMPTRTTRPKSPPKGTHQRRFLSPVRMSKAGSFGLLHQRLNVEKHTVVAYYLDSSALCLFDV